MDLIDEIFGGGTTDFWFGGSGTPGQSGAGYAYGVTGVPVFNASTAGSSDPLINLGIQSGLNLASGLVRQSAAAGAQKAAQEKAIIDRWNQLVQQALGVFTTVSHKLPNITVDDLAAAQNAYNVLAQFVAQYPLQYITDQWQSGAYQGAAQADLQKYQAALSTGAVSGVTAAPSQLATVAGASNLGSLSGIVAAVESNPLLALAGVVVALLVGKALLK